MPQAPPDPVRPWFAEPTAPEAGIEPEPADGPAPRARQIELELGGAVVLRIHRTADEC